MRWGGDEDGEREAIADIEWDKMDAVKRLVLTVSYDRE